MKKRGLKLAAIMLSAAMAFSGVGVLPSVSETAVVEAAKKVSISKTKLTLAVGKKATLKMKNTSKKVTWKTSKKAVATVSKKGVVTAKKKGTAVITATVGGKTYKCKVTVKQPALEITGFDGIGVGCTATFEATNAIGDVSWSSSDKAILDVGLENQEDHSVEVWATGVGTAKLTARCDGMKAATWTVEVTPRLFYIDQVGDDTEGYVPMGTVWLSLTEGETVKKTANIIGHNNSPSVNVTSAAKWSSDNENVVTVSTTGTGDSAELTLTAVGEGEAYVIGEYNGVRDAVLVRVLKNPPVSYEDIEKQIAANPNMDEEALKKLMESISTSTVPTNGLYSPMALVGYSDMEERNINVENPYPVSHFATDLVYNGEELPEAEYANITWKSSDEKVFTVELYKDPDSTETATSYNSSLEVTATGAGTAYLIGTYKGVELRHLVIVQ